MRNDYTGNKYTQGCGDILIIDKKSTKKSGNRYLWEAHFDGYDRKLYIKIYEAQIGNIANPDKPNEYGFLFDLDTLLEEDKHIYNVWKNIEKRCYHKNNKQYNSYGGKGVTVSDDFKLFSKFKKWYKDNLYDSCNLEIDKDCLSTIKHLDNKIYSSDTCILIPNDWNTFLTSINTGIYDTNYGTFCVRIRRNYLKVNKNFKTYEEARIFKQSKDLEYIDILNNISPIPDKYLELIKKYINEVFKYDHRIS